MNAPVVNTLQRGLMVLKCFSQGAEAFGSSELARMTGLPQPTVWRLCKTLESEGFLVADQDGSRFRPGLPLLTLGYAALSATGIAGHAAGGLQKLADQVRGSATLSTCNDLSMLFIHRAVAKDAMLNFNLSVGSSIPIAHSVNGWAYLCALTPGERAPVVAALNATHTAEMKAVRSSREKAMADYAKKGYVINDGVFFPGLTSVAVPFRAGSRNEVFVLSCSAITSIFGTATLRSKAARTLMEIASDLSRLRHV
jgi:DNA-binding IclR family transcriptional regulator